VRNAAKTATTVLGQITRSFQYRDKKIFLALYLRWYVRPHHEFASQAWNPWFVKGVQMLEKVQKRAASLINGLKSAVVGIVTRRHNGVTNWPLPILSKTIPVTSYKSSGFTLLKALSVVKKKI
jgi:hypothetical protein